MLDDNTPHNQNSTTTTLTENVEAFPEVSTQDTPVLEAQQQAEMHDEKPTTAGVEDFASALENFTTESEEAVRETKSSKAPCSS